MTELPTNLFENNQKLKEISLKGNNLTSIEKQLFSLQQLKNLKLGNNPFECSCSLIWLWQFSKTQVPDENAHSDYGINLNSNVEIDLDNIFCQRSSNGNIERIKLLEMDHLHTLCSPVLNNILSVSILLIIVIVIVFCIILKHRKRKKTSSDTTTHVYKRSEIEEYLCEKSVPSPGITWEDRQEKLNHCKRSKETDYFLLCTNKRKDDQHLGIVFV